MWAWATNEKTEVVPASAERLPGPPSAYSMASRVAAKRQERANARKASPREPVPAHRAQCQLVVRQSSPVRDEMGAVRDSIQTQFAERIQQENKEIHVRLATIKPTIDDDTEDDETGVARARLKKEAAARRIEVLATVRRDNAKFFAVVLNAQPVTDTKIWDDGPGSAGAMRAVAAREWKQRRRAEAIELRRRNAEMRERIKSMKAVLDVDISDEAAGAARISMAKATKERRKEEARRIAEQNARNARRLKAVKSVTDTDISDEGAGFARGKMEAETKARKAVEAKALSSANAAHKHKLAMVRPRTDDGDGHNTASWFGNWK